MQEEKVSKGHHRYPLLMVVHRRPQRGLVIAWHLTGEACGLVYWRPDPQLGHTWRDRWDSLKLFTQPETHGWPGMPFPGPGRHLPDQGSGGRLPPRPM